MSGLSGRGKLLCKLALRSINPVGLGVESKENDSEDSEVVDDSDCDPWWDPGNNELDQSDSDLSCPSSPITKEQAFVADQAEKILENEDVNTLVHPVHQEASTGHSSLPSPALVEPQIATRAALNLELQEDPSSHTTLNDPSSFPSGEYVITSEFFQLEDPNTNVQHVDGGANILDSNDATSLSQSTRSLRVKEPSNDITEQLTNQLTVDKSKKTVKRIFDKRDGCIFCNQTVTNFTRHLERKHSNEMEYAKIMAFPKGSKERRREFDKLRKKGNFFNNVNSIREKSGTIIVVKRPTNDADPINFLPCKFCLGFFSSRQLYRHVLKCKSKNNSTEIARGTRVQSIGATLLMNNESCTPELKKEVISIMKNDKITQTVTNDKLICMYGSRLMANHKEKHMKVFVSQKMRELGRLTLNLRSKFPQMSQLAEFIRPENYEAIVNAVKEIAGFNEVQGSFKIPSLAKKLGHSLRACADVLECKGISTQNAKLEEAAAKFNRMMEKQWQFDISLNALGTLNKAKWNKPNLLPLAEDLKCMQTFILEKETVLAKELKLNPNQTLWRDLSEITLAHVIILNRRRAGEAERIMVSHYTDREKRGHIQEVVESLSKIEKTLCNSLTRFETRGKRGNKVPVLLTPRMKENFDLLLSLRETANVLPENPYFFAIPGYESSTLRGSDVLRKYAEMCGAKESTNLTSTKLRKHMATMSQVLHLSQNDMEQLAKFMGHDISVHKNYYRLPENTLQVAKLSKILLLMEKGKVSSLNGKALDNVDLDPVSGLESEDEELSIRDCRAQATPSVEPDVLSPATQILNNPSDQEILEDEGMPIHITKTLSSKKRRKTSGRRPWSVEEKDAVTKHFQKHILLKRVPNKKECDECLLNEPILNRRDWKSVKFCVKNMFPKA